MAKDFMLSVAEKYTREFYSKPRDDDQGKRTSIVTKQPAARQQQVPDQSLPTPFPSTTPSQIQEEEGRRSKGETGNEKYEPRDEFWLRATLST